MSPGLAARLEGRPVDVLLGGFSNEREVSLVSGEAVATALERCGCAVRRLDVGRDFAEQGRSQLAGSGLVFVMLHGEFGEDGQVQRLLEEWGLAYTGSDAASSRAAMDKVRTKEVLETKGICTARWEVVTAGVDPEELAERFGLPLVVKPSCSGSSIGVSIVKSEAEIPAALEEASRHGGVKLVEEYVPGREVTVGVLGEEALPVVELIPARGFYDYSAKYKDDAGTEYLCPAPLPEAVSAALQAEGLAAHRALDCRDFSRVDLRLGADGRGRVLEVNTIPGFTGHSLLPKAAAARGTGFEELVESIAAMALTRSTAGEGAVRGGS
jgi:D-alanine-D-alanine ligase